MQKKKKKVTNKHLKSLIPNDKFYSSKQCSATIWCRFFQDIVNQNCGTYHGSYIKRYIKLRCARVIVHLEDCTFLSLSIAIGFIHYLTSVPHKKFDNLNHLLTLIIAKIACVKIRIKIRAQSHIYIAK